MGWSDILTILGWCKTPFLWIWRRVSAWICGTICRGKGKANTPRETIRVIPHHRGNWWVIDSVKNRPAMQVHGLWHVTNITDGAIRILRSRIIPSRAEGPVAVRHPRGVIFGDYAIPPGETSDVSSQFWIQPPIRKEGRDFKATIYLIDQFGNEHRVRSMIFQSQAIEKQKQAAVPTEALHGINDPIDKGVAAVLKSEIVRYREFGRREGGLGSIRTVNPGGDQRGIVMEWSSPGSRLDPRISNTPRQIRLTSDNAESLMTYYRSLKTEEERKRFIAALLKRCSKETEYAPVGYLILFVLFYMGQFLEGLRVAREALQGDAEWGFSDSLRLVDALLYFEHPSFSSSDLDEIERTVEGIDDGFVQKIRERIAAIRAFRLRQPAPSAREEKP